jgi:predicted metal-dependent phosphotriesterase family hydrolase
LPVRAGVLKAGIGYWGWTAFERRVLAAVDGAHARTGAPVMVHLEHGSAAFELLEVLAGDGVRPEVVLLAHIDRNPDPGLHAELAAAGAYLGYDGFARTRDWPDWVLIDCLVRSAESGATDRLMIGGDVARRTRYVAYGGRPGLAYVGRRVVPRLVQAGYRDLVEAVLVRNPARYLSTASQSSNRGVREMLHSLLRSAAGGRHHRPARLRKEPVCGRLTAQATGGRVVADPILPLSKGEKAHGPRNDDCSRDVCTG